MTIIELLPILLQLLLLFLSVLFKKGIMWYILVVYNLVMAYIAVTENWSGLAYPLIIGITLISIVKSWEYSIKGDII